MVQGKINVIALWIVNNMRQSHLLSKTKKEAPKQAETISHKYLLRGDFVDQLAAGIYNYLPLGWLVYKKVENIIREEMNALGGQELFLPSFRTSSTVFS